MDREIRAAALEWRPDVSNHRAVLASRRAPQQLHNEERGIPDHILSHTDFQRRTLLAFDAKRRAEPQATSLRTLQFLKDAMTDVSSNLAKEVGGFAEDLKLEDRLGTTMRMLRAMERHTAGAISICLHRYPKLADLVDNPYEFGGNLTHRLRSIREHAMELARLHAMEELGKATAAAKSGDAERAARAKKKYSHVLYRLMPGRGSAIPAIQRPNGEFATETGDMASILREHWSAVFKAQGVDEALLQEWLAEDRATRADGPRDGRAVEPPAECAPSHRALQNLRISRQHVRLAIQTSKNTSPGPDGIPYRAWRLLGEVAIQTIHEAIKELSSPEAEQLLQDDMPTFNHSLLTFLPKKAAGSTEDGEDYFLPGGVRPLNITNTDNRVMASAVRIALEPVLAPLITHDQKGFL